MNEEETLKLHRNEVVDSADASSLSSQITEPQPETSPRSKTIVTPFEPARPHTFDQSVLPDEPEHPARRWPIIAGLLVLVTALGIGGYFVIAKRQSLFGGSAKTTPGNPVTQRSLAYSLTVQKMRDGKPYKEPFESSGQEIFENGYKFRLNVSSPQAGYLYVFNEGAPEKDNTNFTIIYPTRSQTKAPRNLTQTRPYRPTGIRLRARLALNSSGSSGLRPPLLNLNRRRTMHLRAKKVRSRTLRWLGTLKSS